MDFYDVLERVLALLQQHKRVTYRALQRQFDLDEAYLEDLKAEIIEARQLAVDEGGRVLVWTGPADATTGLSVPVSYPVPPPTPLEDRSTHATAFSAPTSTSEAERRQLTVLFCDLVDSTSLARHLDPEDYREVVRAYQAASAAVIQRFAGTIAQYLGDGLLVYFGYPQAHEDDAQRAVRAALALLDALAPLKAQLQADKQLRLAVRLGIHTGLVVVGAIEERYYAAELYRIQGELLLARVTRTYTFVRFPPEEAVLACMSRSLGFRLDDLQLHPIRAFEEADTPPTARHHFL
jgi:class 3 adenylate cyclase